MSFSDTSRVPDIITLPSLPDSVDNGGYSIQDFICTSDSQFIIIGSIIDTAEVLIRGLLLVYELGASSYDQLALLSNHDTFNTRFYSITALEADHIAIAGTASSENLSQFDLKRRLYLAKYSLVSKKSMQIFLSDINGPSFGIPRSIVSDNQENLYVTSDSAYQPAWFTGFTNFPRVIKVDSSLSEILWHVERPKNIGSLVQQVGFHDLIKWSDTSFLACGTTRFVDSLSEDSSIVSDPAILLLFDHNGNVLYDSAFSKKDVHYVRHAFYGLEKTSDTSALSFGEILVTQDDPDLPFFQRGWIKEVVISPRDFITSTSQEFRKASLIDLTLYPNPASDELRLSFDDQDRSFHYEIISDLGVRVKAGLIRSKESIDLSYLQRGIYFVRIWHDTATSGLHKFLLLDKK